ncbi:xin actin-binding repeat-containing protein 2-like [Morphnus guianensis]
MPELVEHFCPVGYKREPEVSQVVESNNENQVLPVFGHTISAAESQPENLTEKNTAGTLELADLPLQKGSVELLKQRWESTDATRPGLTLWCSPAPRSLVPDKISCSSTVEKVPADSRRADVFKEETSGGPQQTEHFPITVEELRSHFEALGGKKETESERSSLSSTATSQPGGHSVISLKESSVKRGRAIFEKMSSENGHSNSSEVGSRKPVRGLPKENTPRSDNTPLDFQETVSLKERMAMYKAAVSERDSSNSFARTSEKTKFCTVPGGLAAVRKQFEKVQMTSSQKTFAQYQHQHKSVQETSSGSQHVVSSSTREAECNKMTSKESQTETSQTQEVSHHEQVTHEIKTPSTFTQHTDETVINAAQNEELPKTVTQILKQQIERTAQEKAVHVDRETAIPAKEVKTTFFSLKMENTYQEITLPSTVSSSSTATTSASRLQETSTPREKQEGTATSAMVCSRSHEYESTEKFSLTATSQSTELSSSPTKPTVSPDLYSKQSNLCEPRCLCTCFHSQLRKRLEKHYLNETSNILSGESETRSIMSDVQQARNGFAFIIQMFTRPEKQCLEWHEIWRGEVLSTRWVFENQPFIPIKDDPPDPDKARSIADQETMTQPLDALRARAPVSAGTMDKALALVRGGICAVMWMFDMQPLDTTNKNYHNEEQISDETHIREGSSSAVKTLGHMLAAQNLDKLGQLNPVDVLNLLQLRSELKELKGSVKRSIKYFEPQPLSVTRDNFGQRLENEAVHRVDAEKRHGRIAAAFETCNQQRPGGN